MTKRELTVPEIGLIAGTRVALGVGLGLLLAEKFGRNRKSAGLALLAVGAVSTIPIAFRVFKKPQAEQKLVA
jgi:hypothetical protein